MYISGGAKKVAPQRPMHFANKLETMRRMLIIFGNIYLMDISPLLVKFQPSGLIPAKLKLRRSKIVMPD
jgi:hypothetical protein